MSTDANNQPETQKPEETVAPQPKVEPKEDVTEVASPTETPIATIPAPKTQATPSSSPEDPGKTMAIIGIVCAILIPLIGIIVSVIALNKSKKAGFKNKLAKVGIILGAVFMVIGLIVSVIAIIVIVAASTAINEPVKVSATFASDLSNKNLTKAYSETSSVFKSNHTQAEFDDYLKAATDAGLTIGSTTNKSINSSNGTTTATVVYDATVQDQKYSITVTLIKENGQWLINSFEPVKK